MELRANIWKRIVSLTLSRNIVTIDVTTTSVMRRKQSRRMYCAQDRQTDKHTYKTPLWCIHGGRHLSVSDYVINHVTLTECRRQRKQFICSNGSSTWYGVHYLSVKTSWREPVTSSCWSSRLTIASVDLIISLGHAAQSRYSRTYCKSTAKEVFAFVCSSVSKITEKAVDKIWRHFSEGWGRVTSNKLLEIAIRNQEFQRNFSHCGTAAIVRILRNTVCFWVLLVLVFTRHDSRLSL